MFNSNEERRPLISLTSRGVTTFASARRVVDRVYFKRDLFEAQPPDIITSHYITDYNHFHDTANETA